MTKRGVVIVSVMFGLFVLSFGALGVRALTLGPDAPQPSTTEVASRQQAANSLERSIQTARADVPPALPAIPTRVVAAPAPSPATAAAPVAATSAARQAAPAYGGEEYDDEAYEDDDEQYESEHDDDDDYEEGDHDDD